MHPGHGVVENDDLDGLCGKDLQPRNPVRGRQHTISCSLQEDLANLEPDEFIVHAKDKMGFLFHISIPRCGLAARGDYSRVYKGTRVTVW
jgi:hypothetical protein